jgi:hypothetical protein
MTWAMRAVPGSKNTPIQLGSLGDVTGDPGALAGAFAGGGTAGAAHATSKSSANLTPRP